MSLSPVPHGSSQCPKSPLCLTCRFRKTLREFWIGLAGVFGLSAPTCSKSSEQQERRPLVRLVVPSLRSFSPLRVDPSMPRLRLGFRQATAGVRPCRIWLGRASDNWSWRLGVWKQSRPLDVGLRCATDVWCWCPMWGAKHFGAKLQGKCCMILRGCFDAVSKRFPGIV